MTDEEEDNFSHDQDMPDGDGKNHKIISHSEEEVQGANVSVSSEIHYIDTQHDDESSSNNSSQKKDDIPEGKNENCILS